MTIEELLDLQEAGSSARALGLPSDVNPYKKSAEVPGEVSLRERLGRYEAWRFGWESEDASRDGIFGSFIETDQVERRAILTGSTYLPQVN